MPLYEFRCDHCGDFEQWRTLAELEISINCPYCQTVAKRIFSPPNINLNSGSVKLRHGLNQEPKLVKRDQNAEPPMTPQYTQKRNGRPWMINH